MIDDVEAGQVVAFESRGRPHSDGEWIVVDVDRHRGEVTLEAMRRLSQVVPLEVVRGFCAVVEPPSAWAREAELAAKRAALEEAARVCDEMEKEADAQGYAQGYPAGVAARRIRALASALDPRASP